MPTLNHYPQHPELAEINAALKLISLVDESLNKNVPVLLLLSGGTWIQSLDKSDLSALKLNPHLDKLTITTLDERVDFKPENNNFNKLLSSKNISTLIKLGANFINTIPKNGENSFSFGERINKSLKNYLFNNSHATLIATVGVGGENNVLGHIAGIEPMENKNLFNDHFQNPDILYRGYLAQKLQPSPRATATFTLLDKVNCFVLLILNPEEKRQSLNKILSEDQLTLFEFPCTYFRHRPNTTIFTDIPKT
ncbi:MAG: 6-phosphogluconolactonase [Candidatus Shapirobacteria bacterium]|jgi:6-phosphogluconolactonase/glucosamine-6-phosphate isomerase/deaminase